MDSRKLLVGALVAAASLLSACGGGGDGTVSQVAALRVTNSGLVPAPDPYAPIDENAAAAYINSERKQCGFGVLNRGAGPVDVAARAASQNEDAVTGATQAGYVGEIGVWQREVQRVTPVAALGDWFTRLWWGRGQVATLAASTTADFMVGGWKELSVVSRIDGHTYGSVTVVTGLPSGTQPQGAPGVRTWPCDGSNVAGQEGVKLRLIGADVRVISASVVDAGTGAAVLASIDPQEGYCAGDRACVTLPALAPQRAYNVDLAGTQRGEPFTRRFRFETMTVQ